MSEMLGGRGSGRRGTVFCKRHSALPIPVQAQAEMRRLEEKVDMC